MIQFTGNWYIDMGILGMLNLLKEQLPEVEIDEILQKNINELKDTFSYAYLKSELLKRKASNEDYIAKTEKKLNNSKNKKDLTEKQRKDLETEKNELDKLKDLQPYRNELINSINEIEPSSVWDTLSSVYSNEIYIGKE